MSSTAKQNHIKSDFELDEKTKQNLDQIIASANKDKSNLIQILQETQDLLHYLPESVLAYIATQLDVTEHWIYGVATFYSQFKFIKPGKHIIKVCMGTACHVRGSNSIKDKIETELDVKVGETTEDGLFSLEEVFCLGCCALAPVMVIDDEVFGSVTSAKLKRILTKFQKEEEEL